MMAAAGVVAWQISTVAGAWKFLLALGAGTGLVYLLRWFWWRINAWSEVSAMAAALVVSLTAQAGLGLSTDDPRGFAWLLLLTTAATTAVWLTVTWLTPPEPTAHLRAFYARVRPGGPGWRAVAPEAPGEGHLGQALLRWAGGCLSVYLALFGLGTLLLGAPWRGGLELAASALVGGWLWRTGARSAGPGTERADA
jgi:hypothetical protein